MPSDPVSSAKAHQHQPPPPPQDPEDNHTRLCETCLSPAELQINMSSCFCRECYSEHIRGRIYYNPDESYVMCLKTGNQIVIHLVKLGEPVEHVEPVEPVGRDGYW